MPGKHQPLFAPRPRPSNLDRHARGLHIASRQMTGQMMGHSAVFWDIAVELLVWELRWNGEAGWVVCAEYLP